MHIRLKMFLLNIIFVVTCLPFSLCYDCAYCQPEQVHLAFGEKSNDIVVTWTTYNDTEESIVKYGQGMMNNTAHGSSGLFIDGGHLKRQQWIHRVTLRDLHFNTKYVYHVGSSYGWSDVYYFKTPPEGEQWILRAALYGDMGTENAHSMSYLQEESQRGLYDVIIHVGDFAYDMHDNNAQVGDQFMRQIQSVAAYVPYMTCPGNHEEKYNFSNYKARFSMPGPYDSMMYSWDLGPVHFISISTEFYYFLNYGFHMVRTQYEWLKNDLDEATKPENRQKRPWIVLYGHRPMYCSNSDDIDCSLEYTRVGLPILRLYGLESYLKDYGVDLVIWAHEHSYERTWPLFDKRVYNGSYEQPYVNPGAPVHVVTGSAGCKEDLSPFSGPRPYWSAVRVYDYGYTKFYVYNNTHMHLEQISATNNGKVVDDFWMVKNKHERYNL